MGPYDYGVAPYEPPYQDLHCLQSQLFSCLVLKELTQVSKSCFNTEQMVKLFMSSRSQCVEKKSANLECRI